ncbi:MAG: 4-hydroxy-tetrahydrodipicolinate reductase [Betaproteobacteria bacterium]|nr:4-hydroxy-tetrahydrodipicolinate reductase [Betaproteobacteria bacterium]
MEKMRIVIAGASGRMGKTLVEAVLGSADCTLAAALDQAGSPALGREAAEFMGRTSGVAIGADIEAAVKGADFFIDFTRPEGTLEHLSACVKHGVKMIIGTTGFEAAGKQAIEAASRKIGIVFAPNMSVGVNLTLKLLEIAGSVLQEGYDVEILEVHHRMKIDAPSGTALRMGEVVAKALGRDHDAVAVHGREGVTGARKDESIGYAVLRGGDAVGDHTVMFMGQGERVEIAHKASSRMTYAQGALRACRFLREKKTGLFDMQDVLGL